MCLPNKLPYITVPTDKLPLKEKMVKLEIEKSNICRLITLNSSVEDFNLNSFLSSTESVMVEESGELKQDCSYAEMRFNTSFPMVTALSNFIKFAQVGNKTKCYLSSRITWPTKERSEDRDLSIEFLAKYSAAIRVHLMHSLSICEREDNPEREFKKKASLRSKPQVAEFVRLRAPIRNLAMSMGLWDLSCNTRP